MVDLGTCHVLIMSIGFFFLTSAFQIIVFIMVLIEGLRFKENYFTGLGSLCLIVIYVVAGLSVLFVPFLISVTGPKITMLVGCATHILFVTCLLHPHPISMCCASILVGFGSALLWVSQGNYIVRNSTEKSAPTNCALFWILFQTSFVISSIFIYFRFLDITVIHNSFRMSTIYLLLGLSCSSFLFYLLLPSCTREDYLSENRPTVQQIALGIGNLFQAGHILVLGVPFFLLGANVIFLTVGYGLAIGHSLHLERPKQLAPLSAVFIGLGEVVGGAIFLIVGACGGRSTRNALVIFGCVLLVLALILILLNLPNEAPFGDTDDLSLIESSAILVIGSSFLLGLGDACFNTQILTTLAVKYPQNSASVFAVFKFFKVFGILVAIIYSAFLILYGVIVILMALSIFTTICLIISETMAVGHESLFESKQTRKTVSGDLESSSKKSLFSTTAVSPPVGSLRAKMSATTQENIKANSEDQSTETDFIAPHRTHRGFLRRLLVGSEDFEDDQEPSSRPSTPPEDPRSPSLPSINLPPSQSALPQTPRVSKKPRHHTSPIKPARSKAEVDVGASEPTEEPKSLQPPEEIKRQKPRKSMIKRLTSEPELVPPEIEDEKSSNVMEDPKPKKYRKRSKLRTEALDEQNSDTVSMKLDGSAENTGREKPPRKGALKKKMERKATTFTAKTEVRKPD